jgi:hypothetical protein
MQTEEISRRDRKKAMRDGVFRPRTLDELAVLSHGELLTLYSHGSVPTDMKALDGDLRGRMLAVRGTAHGPVFQALAALGGSPKFPWEGKTLTAKTRTEGVGINRIKIPGLGRQKLFPFATHFDPSAVDRDPCVFIDYDNEDNPSLVRSIRDEVRQISTDIYFGPVLLKRGTSATLLLWFALQGRAN